jgi:hypothetical protein
MTAVRTDINRVPGRELGAALRPDANPQRAAPDAASFCRAAAALATDPPESDSARRHTAEAAAALMRWAATGGQGLAEVLRPDPADRGPVTWTVACYQIGDLSPTALRDFGDVVEAVPALASCPDAAHVAAELMASTARGLRWTAMTRTGEVVRFQLLSSDTGSAAAAPDDEGIEAAQRRWQDQLARWAADPAEMLAAAPEPRRYGETDEILDALRSLDRRIAALIAAQELGSRFEALERRVTDLQLQFQGRAAPSPPMTDWRLVAYVRGATAVRSARLARSRVWGRLVGARARNAAAADDRCSP